MSKRVSSPSPRWPGAVIFADPMTLPQALSWEKAIRSVQERTDVATITDINYAILPGICTCVEKWELDGLGQLIPDTFPATPRKLSIELINWLIGEITTIYSGEEAKADPNA